MIVSKCFSVTREFYYWLFGGGRCKKLSKEEIKKQKLRELLRQLIILEEIND